MLAPSRVIFGRCIGIWLSYLVAEVRYIYWDNATRRTESVSSVICTKGIEKLGSRHPAYHDTWHNPQNRIALQPVLVLLCH